RRGGASEVTQRGRQNLQVRFKQASSPADPPASGSRPRPTYSSFRGDAGESLYTTDLEAVAHLNSSVTSDLCADRTGNSAVIQPHVVEEWIRHIAVAIIRTHKRPGEIGVVEDVEEVEAYFQLVSFKREWESFVHAQIHRVDFISAQRISSRNVCPYRRIDDVLDIRRVDRVSVRIDVVGRRCDPKQRIENGHRVRWGVQVDDRRTIVGILQITIQIDASDEWGFNRSGLYSIDSAYRPQTGELSLPTVLWSRDVIDKRHHASMRHIEARHAAIGATVKRVRCSACAAGRNKHFAVHVVDCFRVSVSKPEKQTIPESAFDS